MPSSLLSSRPLISASSPFPRQRAVSSSSSSSSFFNFAHFCQPPSSRQQEANVQSARFPPVECSSRPRKKCTAHHNKSRPKKHSLSDKNRKPPVYPKPPTPPPSIVFGWDDEDDVPVEEPTSTAIEIEPVVSGA